MFNTPVLFLIFNRPDLTEKVFEKIKEVKPAQLFIAADGPRDDKVSEYKICNEARNVVMKNINWKCDVATLFQPRNLGCKEAVSMAIDWFFNHVEEGIILEDDTVPDISFFEFCEKMLTRYRHDKSIMHIGGVNFQLGNWRGDGDYYYSRYVHIWGWATWKRAWLNYDIRLENWETFKKKSLPAICNNDKAQITYWQNSFQAVFENKIDTWDIQWHYSVWNQNGVSLVPNKNLIKNIGFRADATHTISANNVIQEIPLQHISEFRRPGSNQIQTEADNFTFNQFYNHAPGKKYSGVHFIKHMIKGLRRIKKGE